MSEEKEKLLSIQSSETDVSLSSQQAVSSFWTEASQIITEKKREWRDYFLEEAKEEELTERERREKEKEKERIRKHCKKWDRGVSCGLVWVSFIISLVIPFYIICQHGIEGVPYHLVEWLFYSLLITLFIYLGAYSVAYCYSKTVTGNNPSAHHHNTKRYRYSEPVTQIGVCRFFHVKCMFCVFYSASIALVLLGASCDKFYYTSYEFWYAWSSGAYSLFILLPVLFSGMSWWERMRNFSRIGLNMRMISGGVAMTAILLGENYCLRMYTCFLCIPLFPFALAIFTRKHTYPKFIMIIEMCEFYEIFVEVWEHDLKQSCHHPGLLVFYMTDHYFAVLGLEAFLVLVFFVADCIVFENEGVNDFFIFDWFDEVFPQFKEKKEEKGENTDVDEKRIEVVEAAQFQGGENTNERIQKIVKAHLEAYDKQLQDQLTDQNKNLLSLQNLLLQLETIQDDQYQDITDNQKQITNQQKQITEQQIQPLQDKLNQQIRELQNLQNEIQQILQQMKPQQSNSNTRQ